MSLLRGLSGARGSGPDQETTGRGEQFTHLEWTFELINSQLCARCQTWEVEGLPYSDFVHPPKMNEFFEVCAAALV